MQTGKLLFLSAWVIIFSCGQKPTGSADHVKWLSLSEASARLQNEKRPI
jgi:hypothetical protein